MHHPICNQTENVCENIFSLKADCVVDVVGGEAQKETEVFSTVRKSQGKQLSIVDLVILIITVFIHHNPHQPSE